MTDRTDLAKFTPWDGLAQHLGRWQGRFIQFDPVGLIPIGERQSLITFEALAGGGIQQTNVYFELEEPIEDGRPGQSWVYHDLAGGLRFFPDGSFSNGRLQLAPFSDFGAEQGFLWQDRKARVVTQFARGGELSGITVILEVRGSWAEQGFQTSLLTPDRIHRSWRGRQICFKTSDLIPTESPIEFSGSLQQNLGLLPGNLWISGARQVPDPLKHRDRSFRLELGWMPDPQVYLQLIREYDSQGAWQQITWIQASATQ